MKTINEDVTDSFDIWNDEPSIYKGNVTAEWHISNYEPCIYNGNVTALHIENYEPSIYNGNVTAGRYIWNNAPSYYKQYDHLIFNINLL